MNIQQVILGYTCLSAIHNSYNHVLYHAFYT